MGLQAFTLLFVEDAIIVTTLNSPSKEERDRQFSVRKRRKKKKIRGPDRDFLTTSGKNFEVLSNLRWKTKNRVTLIF